MTTTVILEGAMGNKFGKEWVLHVDSPAEALRLISANEPEFITWVRDNLITYEGYEVTCEYVNGESESIGEEAIEMSGDLTSIRFTPVVVGSGNVAKIIAGVVIVAVVAYLTLGTGLFAVGGAMAGYGGAAVAVGLAGASMAIGGIVGMLTPQPKSGVGADAQQRVDKTSHYFNGAVNTTMQGVGVALIYGDECLVGSHAVSASLTVDEEVV